MSSSSLLESGGGGDDTDDERSEHRRGVTITSEDGSATLTLPASLQALASEASRILFMVRQPLVFVVAVLLGVQVSDFNIVLFTQQEGPLWNEVAVPLIQKGPIAVILDDFLYRTILVPAGAGLLGFLAGIVTGVLDAFGFLANLVLGPFGLSAQGLTTAAAGITASIRGFNVGLVEPVTALGVGAQPAATAIGVGQIALAAWLGWILVRSFDVPLIQPVNALLAVTRPIRNAIGGLFGR